MMAIRFARGTPWEFKLRGISTTKSTRSVLKAEFKAMGVQELQVERDLDDEVDEECAALRGKIRGALLYTLQVGNPACCAFKFALVSEVRLHGRSIERKLINKDNNLTLKTHTK
jgi:hypothetical protein